MCDLARAADVVLPGAAWVEKDSTYTNDQGRVQAAARALPLPGDAKDDREILLRVARATGQSLPYQTAADVRVALADALEHLPAYRDLRTITFARPVAVGNWLQASNPSERWKWDYLFQDLAPVKFEWMRIPETRQAIPLKPIAAGSVTDEE